MKHRVSLGYRPHNAMSPISLNSGVSKIRDVSTVHTSGPLVNVCEAP